MTRFSVKGNGLNTYSKDCGHVEGVVTQSTEATSHGEDKVSEVPGGLARPSAVRNPGLCPAH